MQQPLNLDQIEAVVRNAALLGADIAPETAKAMAAEIRSLRDRVAELEAFAYGCDAEGCVLPHSYWCERAKKTAAENNGCTCGQPWTGHPQPHAMHCWTVTPPRSEIDEMRRALAAMRTKTLTTEADEIVLHCPDHSPQDQDGVWMDCHCAVADDMRRRAAAPAAAEETHVVADDSSDPEPYRFVDDDGDYLHIGIPASPACGRPAISFHTATEPVHVPVEQIGGLIAALRRLAAVRP